MKFSGSKKPSLQIWFRSVRWLRKTDGWKTCRAHSIFINLHIYLHIGHMQKRIEKSGPKPQPQVHQDWKFYSIYSKWSKPASHSSYFFGHLTLKITPSSNLIWSSITRSPKIILECLKLIFEFFSCWNAVPWNRSWWIAVRKIAVVLLKLVVHSSPCILPFGNCRSTTNHKRFQKSEQSLSEQEKV